MKSLAGVRVPWKIVCVISSRLIAIDSAARRSLPSSPEKCARLSGIVNDWKIAAGWFTARSPRSDSYVASAESGIASSTSRFPASRSE